MKKSFNAIMVVLFFSAALFSGCKKNNQFDALSVQKKQKEVTMYSGAQAARQQGTSTMPIVKVNISASLYDKLSENQNLVLVKTGDGEYEAQTAMATLPTGIAATAPDPGNPCDLASLIAQFNAWMAVNRPTFLAIANQTCTPYWGGWSDPVPCICFLFVVYPNSPRCNQAQTYVTAENTTM